MAQTIQSTLPTKRIVSKAHLDAWLDSPTHADVVRFVEQLNQSVVGVKLTDTVEESQARPCSRSAARTPLTPHSTRPSLLS